MPHLTGSACKRVTDFWDEVTNEWLAGGDPMPEPLPSWYESYAGRGAGQVTRDGFAEPYLGDLAGSPRIVTLGLNPGRFHAGLQSRDGTFAGEIRELGSYRAWATGNPYLGEVWESLHGPNRYHRNRLGFARHWLDDQSVEGRDVLTMELYPWHSTKVTAAMRPPAEVVDEFIWQPLAELEVSEAFAFGKPWLRICETLGLPMVGRWGTGGDSLGSPVASRTVVGFELPSAQWVLVCWQSGYAGPPAATTRCGCVRRSRALVQPANHAPPHAGMQDVRRGVASSNLSACRVGMEIRTPVWAAVSEAGADSRDSETSRHTCHLGEPVVIRPTWRQSAWWSLR